MMYWRDAREGDLIDAALLFVQETDVAPQMCRFDLP